MIRLDDKKQKEIVSLIKKKRKNKKLSQAELSIKAGLPRDTVFKLEANITKKICFYVIERIINVFDMTIQDFLDELDNMYTTEHNLERRVKALIRKIDDPISIKWIEDQLHFFCKIREK